MPEVRVVITDRCILPFEEESLPPYQFHVPVHFLVQYGLRCADGPDSLEEPVFPCKAEFGQFPRNRARTGRRSPPASVSVEARSAVQDIPSS